MTLRQRTGRPQVSKLPIQTWIQLMAECFARIVKRLAIKLRLGFPPTRINAAAVNRRVNRSGNERVYTAVRTVSLGNSEPKTVSFVLKDFQSDSAELDAMLSKLTSRDQSNLMLLKIRKWSRTKKISFSETLAKCICRREQEVTNYE